jgi:ribose 1,5-bisphosphate isomerase
LKSDTYIRDINTLRIEGATNVALAGVDAVIARLGELKKNHYEGLISFRRKLEKIRITEPALRNYMRFIFKKISSHDSPSELKKKLEDGRKWLREHFTKSRAKVEKYGAKLIKDGDTVFIHCHSGTVSSVINKALGEKKSFKVIVSETRPFLWGRNTAKEFGSKGVDITCIVDSASNMFIRDADIVFVGADAITADGDLFNKIGTSLIALSAKEHGVPLYSCTHAFKFDPETMSGYEEPIEERDPKEVWRNHPKGVSIRNPVFDKTPAAHLKGYVTELGVLPPKDVLYKVVEEYPWMTHGDTLWKLKEIFSKGKASS